MKLNHLKLVFFAIISSIIFNILPIEQANAGVQDFSFSNFEADYYLSKDADGRSTMKVVEQLTAQFPEYNQNKGIVRAIPAFYDGHSLSFKLSSLTRNGQPEPIYSQYSQGQNTVIETGTEDYILGKQTFVFTYTLRDVTKTFDSGQELYWDTNGTGWNQNFDQLTARVHLDNSVSGSFTQDISCYQGASGSNEKCTGEVNGSTITFNSTRSLTGGENVTFDLSFKPGSFSTYQMGLTDYIPYALIAISIFSFFAGIYIKIKYGRNFRGRGTIVAQYLPPKDVSVLTASEVIKRTSSSLTAQIIDLAVRQKIRIIESKEKFLFVETTKYTLELLNFDGLSDNELKLVDILFTVRNVGSKYTFDKSDYSKGLLLQDFTQSLKKESIKSGYRLELKKQNTWQIILLLVNFISSFAATVLWLIGGGNSLFIIGILIIFVSSVSIALFGLISIKPLTQAGRELFDYLQGLRLYIKMVEINRIKFLQSPQGAERKAIDTNDVAQMIILYEKTLPYAILFGQEKKWVKQLGNFYESAQSSPQWYSGINGFNVAAFSSSINSFSSYANSSAFSSSSGAGGGGSSGGGGGGGGGGGR